MSRTRIVVCLSKFGSLALIRADSPGAYFGTVDSQADGALNLGSFLTYMAASPI